MKRSDKRWLWALAGGLLVASVVFYVVQILIFDRARDTFFYIFQDLGFLPLTVLIVGLVIERLISVREKRILVHKLNMVVGIFFSELGTPLLAQLLPSMDAQEQIKKEFHLTTTWQKSDFARARRFADGLDCPIDLHRIDRAALTAELFEQRQFVLRLLENPNLMEHERFTDLLWAVHHLEEELQARIALSELLPADEDHLEIDVRRAFKALLSEWALYAQHLKADYPYLFSLVVRTHPFQDAPSPVIAG